eukprot:8027709-Lingulodinium_polyedra.AAC.1
MGVLSTSGNRTVVCVEHWLARRKSRCIVVAMCEQVCDWPPWVGALGGIFYPVGCVGLAAHGKGCP